VVGRPSTTGGTYLRLKPLLVVIAEIKAQSGEHLLGRSLEVKVEEML